MLLHSGWIAVPLSNYIDFDPENVPLEIQTNSRLGSNERTNLTFYTSQNTYAGGFAIKFSSKPKYLLPHCTSWTKFPKTLPSPTTKIWRIAVQDIDPSVRLVVQIVTGNRCLKSRCQIAHVLSQTGVHSGGTM